MTITYSKWIAIPLFIRQQIAQKFGITKIRSTSVINNVVVDDGFDIHNVETSLSVEAMQTFLDSKEKDPNVLLQGLVDKYTPAPVKKVEVVAQPEPTVEQSNAKPERTKVVKVSSEAKAEQIMRAFPKAKSKKK